MERGNVCTKLVVDKKSIMENPWLQTAIILLILIKTKTHIQISSKYFYCSLNRKRFLHSQCIYTDWHTMFHRNVFCNLCNLSHLSTNCIFAVSDRNGISEIPNYPVSSSYWNQRCTCLNAITKFARSQNVHPMQRENQNETAAMYF